MIINVDNSYVSQFLEVTFHLFKSLEMKRFREKASKWVPSARLSLCLMVFWGQIQNYMMRSTLSLLIVAMVDVRSNHTGDNSTEMTCLSEEINLSNQTTESSPSDVGDNTLDWDGGQIGHVLGAFNIGYICTQVGVVRLILTVRETV